MTKPIIAGLFAFTLLALLAMWIIGGGPRRAVTEVQESVASAFDSANEYDASGFRLPWQPVDIFPVPDITSVGTLGVTAPEPVRMVMNDPGGYENDLVALEAEYDQLNAAASKQRTFGTPSPYAGKIGIVQDVSGVRSSNPREEYIQIAANYSNAAAIDIAGWSLESALTGMRIQIPPAAAPYIEGSANILGPVMLNAGDVAHVTTAVSPLGVSFRENMCTGYLNQKAQFMPFLAEACPSPSQTIPTNEENLRSYGDRCFDVITNAPSCRTPNVPQDALPACRTILSDALSYNGCVSRYRFRSGFAGDVWRIYLGTSRELWLDSHDAIRLLDAEGRTVSVFTY